MSEILLNNQKRLFDSVSKRAFDSSDGFIIGGDGVTVQDRYGNTKIRRLGTTTIKGEGNDDVDRNWYDQEEEGGCVEQDSRIDESLLEKERQYVSRMKERQNIKARALAKDREMWDQTQMLVAGVGGRRQVTHLKGEGGGADVEEERDYVVVRESKPPFLSNAARTFTRVQTTVPVIRDTTSDMAKLSKNGSQVVRNLRQQEERSKTRPKFWEVKGTMMGDALGLKDDKKDETDQVDDCDVGKKGNQYAQAFKNSASANKASEFARANSIQAQRRALPVFDVREGFLQAIREHRVLIVVGQTGSGKTTQLTQYLYEAGFTKAKSAQGKSLLIGCTQPRRVAAVSVASRVAEEVGCELGQEVGYSIRFEDVTSENTQIKYMTDGVLLRESINDPDLDKYSCVIMDEAHERSLNTDVLFGVLRSVVSRRTDFTLIVTSATMDKTKFSNFFGGAPTFEIPGRTFSVNTHFSKSCPDDYVDSAVQKALQIHCSHAGEAGDILIFMTGQEDIEATCRLLAERAETVEGCPPLSILPIYSQLASDLQAKIFAPSESRKVIVATNIAETSLTVDGIKFVIDAGFCKLKVYNPKIGMDSLQVVPISQANAMQRAGRAGRTGPGECHRLYTEQAFIAELLENNVPEIQRTNLANVVLLLKSLGIQDITKFDFMDPPPTDALTAAMHTLWVLGALDNFGQLTQLGKVMSQFPLDPPLSKMLIAAQDGSCTAEVLTIVAMLSNPSVFLRPKGQEEESDGVREKFAVHDSDHLTLLNVYNQWERNGRSSNWATSHFLNYRTLVRVREVRAQLLDIMSEMKIPHISCGQADWESVRKAVCAGYFHNAARMRGIGEYVNLRTGVPCHLHPTSSLYNAGFTPEFIVYHEVVLTTKEYMQTVTSVEPKWLATVGPMFFTLKGKGNCSLNDETDDAKVAEIVFRAQLEKDTRKMIMDQNSEQDSKLQTGLNEKMAVVGGTKILNLSSSSLFKTKNRFKSVIKFDDVESIDAVVKESEERMLKEAEESKNKNDNIVAGGKITVGGLVSSIEEMDYVDEPLIKKHKFKARLPVTGVPTVGNVNGLETNTLEKLAETLSTKSKPGDVMNSSISSKDGPHAARNQLKKKHNLCFNEDEMDSEDDLLS